MKCRWLNRRAKQAVIVVTYEGSPFIDEALEHLRGYKKPILLCINTEDDNAYDPAGFYLAKEMGLKSFILLHDSCMVKDVSILDRLFDMPGNIAFSPRVLMCMGKFENVPDLPVKPHDKMSAIDFETNLPSWLPIDKTLWQDFYDNDKREWKHGKERMIIENQWLKKYKGCWSPSMV